MRTPFLLVGVLLSAPGLLLSGAEPIVPEALPLLDWEGRHLPALPAAWQPLADSALAAAKAWVGKATPWDPAAAARATTAFHVVGWALPRAPGLPPEPVATGWWAADPAQAAAALPLVAGWPGQPAVVAGGRLTLTHPRTPAVGATTVEGMRLRLHGQALAACLNPLMGQRPSWEKLLTAMAGWTLEATVDPGGGCRIATGIPLSALAPVDQDVVARLPKARWTVAFGIAPHAAGTDPTVLPGGTWALSWNGGDHLAVAIPDGPEVTAWLERWTDQLPVQDEYVRIRGGDGFWLGREANGWLLTLDEEDQNRPKWGRSAPRCFGHLAWYGEPPEEDASAAPQPWPLAELPGLLGADAQAQDRQRSWYQRLPGLGALLGPTSQAVVFTADSTGQAVLTTKDGTLTGLLSALALRWFADEVADQRGMARLRHLLTRLKTAGIPVTRDELVAQQPVVPDAAAWLDRARTWHDPSQEVDYSKVQRALASSRLPLRVANARQLQDARTFSAEIAPLLALPADQIASIPWQGVPATERPELEALSTPLRAAMETGLLLVRHGDAAGLHLVDAVRAAQSKMVSYGEDLTRAHAKRDQAWLTATIQGFGDAPPWIAEPYTVEGEYSSAWAGDRFKVGRCALAWLGDPLEMTRRGSEVRHPLHPTWERADYAAALAEWLERLAKPGGPGWGPTSYRQSSQGLLSNLPDTELIEIFHWEMIASRIQHHLVRLAGAIVLQARRGPLPAKAADLGLDLTVPGPRGPLPCTWELLDAASFRLALKTSGPAPAGIPITWWQHWQNAPRPALDATLVCTADPPLIQVHQTAVAAPTKVDF